MRVAALLGAITALLATGCLGETDARRAEPAPPSSTGVTELTIRTVPVRRVDSSNPLGLTTAIHHLRCDPPGGDVADPAIACVQLMRRPEDYVGQSSAEFALFVSGGTVEITGTLGGTPIHTIYRFGEYPQAAAWLALLAGRSLYSDVARPTPASLT